MKKIFMMSDIHGFYDEMIQALDKAGFDKENPDHVIVLCGDLCDRGQKPKECLEFINAIPAERKLVIVGNHEILMEEMMKRGYPKRHDVHNRTLDSAQRITDVFDCDIDVESAAHERKFDQIYRSEYRLWNFPELDEYELVACHKMKTNSLWKEYKKSWRWYAEVGEYIFVHGWIFCSDHVTKLGETLSYKYHPDWRTASNAQWKLATWVNGMYVWDLGIREPGKTIVMGHWHTSYGHSKLHNYGVDFIRPDMEDYACACFDPFIDDGIIALDACTTLSHKVNVVVREVTDSDWKKGLRNKRLYSSRKFEEKPVNSADTCVRNT